MSRHNTETVSNVDRDEGLNLAATTCPNREDRASGINVFYGKASQLVEDAKAGRLRNHEREFQQSSGCPLNFYLAVRVTTIREAVTIFHAPIGCSSSALGYRELYRGIPNSLGRPDFDVRWLTTNLNADDVVFGAGEKLRHAILEAQERYSPKAIFILASCTSGIIGEDLEGVIASVQDTVGAKLIPVHCEGVRSRLMQTGYDAFWHGVLKHLVRKTGKKKQPALVNVASMLSYCWQDRLEVTRLLGKLGLRPNFVPEFATVGDFEQLSEAAVTAPLCPTYTDYLSRGLWQEHGVPFFMYPSPMGIENTDNWLREIARHTGKLDVVDKVIAEEHEVWVPRLHAIREQLEGFKGDGTKMSILGSLGQGRLLAQMPFFHELGLNPAAAITQDFDNLILDEVDNLVKERGDFEILVNTFQAAEQSHLTRKLDPDLTLTCPFQGPAFKRMKAATRIHSLRGDPMEISAQSGYAGAIAFGEFILRALRSPGFHQTFYKKTADSYKPWFYEQPDPLYFVPGKEAQEADAH